MPGRLLWEPAIYEHKAALIGRPPADVAYSADLLCDAMVAEYQQYRADLLTVGVDIYNIEAEACGAKVDAISSESCPEIASPPWSIDDLPELRLPDIPHAGRFSLIAEATLLARRRIGDAACLRAGVSGPVSIAAKLVGLEALIMSAACAEPAAGKLLEFSLQLALRWTGYLRGRGVDVVLFDSAASPPNFSPDMYCQMVLPLHQRLMAHLKQAGQVDRPLVMGGDTISIVDALCASGATTILCDYAADAERFAAGIPSDARISIRRNVSPPVLADDPIVAADRFVHDLRQFASPIAGTGILPYDFRPELLHAFRDAVEARWYQR